VKYLLDTGIWIWSISATERINETAQEILRNGSEEIYLSAVTSWEVSIKMQLGKLRLPDFPAQCVPAFAAKQGLRLLSVTHDHAFKVFDLPLHHRDPFDRLIISQAIVEDLVVLTADRIFAEYPVKIMPCGK
jgi:PIN domain nuclease of toxin-antitoxin system